MCEKQQNKLNMENFEMLKALYDFQAVYPKTISFDEGEYFILHQTSARQRNWWQVVSMKGNIGFVPSNYVMKLKVEPEFLIGFLESSIESLKLSKETEINGIIMREELIQKLEEKKVSIQSLIDEEAGNPINDDQPYDGGKVLVQIANGRLKNSETSQENPPMINSIIPEKSSKHSKSHHHSAKTEFHKKSMSTPAVSTQIPQLVNESPSMNVLSPGKHDEPIHAPPTSPQPQNQPQPQIPTSKPTHYDNSIASEPSDTTTTTTTSDEITTVSKVEATEKIIENDKLIKTEIKSSTSESDSMKQFDQENQLIQKEAKLESSKEKVVIGEQEVYQIVDAIRQNTNLSHEYSCVALRIVLSELETILPQEALKYLEPVVKHLTAPLAAPENLLGHTHDAQRLRIIFSDLADCKNDTEQRSWMLYEDEEDICRFLKELIGILSSADSKICCHEMSVDQYQSTMNLVLYYQMEPRWTIRKLVLDALKSMCYLDFTAVSIILNSVLPIEIVEDMKVSITKVARLKELAQVLTIVFSIGQKMPVTHEENLGTDFVLFLLTIIETPPDEDVHCVLPDAMINLLLSFNLQFDDFATNIVLEAMKKITDAKTFTEKILLLINREEDPIKLLTHTPPPVNSVLKMFVDLFSTKETAELFYMNDNKVLIDILVRQLSDLSPGDQLRKWYLELCRRILRNTNYPEHTHRKQDLMKIFTRIFCEETECSAKDQQLVREIANEFPQIFKACNIICADETRSDN